MRDPPGWYAPSVANLASTEEFPIPIALCLERIGAVDDERYVRCTARSGRLSGLAIGLSGEILWCQPEPVACELWVSRDQRLMALRPAGAPRVRLVRARREIEIPEEKPVVLRHGDELVLADLAGVRFCVHVHGTTREVHAPRPVLSLRAASLAIALSVGACGGNVSPLLEASAETGEPSADASADTEGAFRPALETGADPEDTGSVFDTGRALAPAGDGGAQSPYPAAIDAGLSPVDEPDAIEIRNAPPK